MRIVYLIIIAALLCFIGLMIWKMIRERAIYDKMNGLSLINANVVILILVFGFLDGRPSMYIDIAIAYAILGFVGNLVVSRYVAKYSHRESPDQNPAQETHSNKHHSHKGGAPYADH